MAHFLYNCISRFSPPFYENNYHERRLGVQRALILGGFTFIRAPDREIARKKKKGGKN